MELRDLGGALWRQRLLVLAILVVTALACALGLWLAPKTYTATATLSARTDTSVETSERPAAGRGTLAELASSRTVLADVSDALPVRRDIADLQEHVRGRRVETSTLIRITAEDRDPEVAAEIANTVVRVLPLHDPSGAFLFTTSDAAEPPTTWTSPDVPLTAAVGALVALCLAMAAAVSRDRRTRTVADGAAVEDRTSAPLLGHLDAPHDPATLDALHPGTPGADAFAQLRTAVEAEAVRRPGRPLGRLVVAGLSADPADVWLGANLAVALAGAGHRVLLVDGRTASRPGSAEDQPDSPGLAGVLTGAPLAEAVVPGPAAGLVVLPAGDFDRLPGDAGRPATLLAARFAGVVRDARSLADVVVVLAAPLDASDDARVLAAGGALLLLVPEGGVTGPALRAHADRVRAVGAGLLGVVLLGPHPAERTP